jgi:serine/threonine protein kinase
MNPAITNVRIVGRYALYGVLASGGMATVHFGRLIGPVGFSRTVAIKRLHAQFASDPEFVAMFLDEARLAARIRHPNVVPTLDVVATTGELFLVMEYVPGESLARLVRAARGRGDILPPGITVAIMVGVLQGLHAAHEAKNERGLPLGIVHRDVSPQNVLVGSDGQARVLDFGVAKAAGRVQTTREGQLKGKLAYMAPEQLRGENCSRKPDISAAAVVLWEALTGERLFRADNEGAVIAKVLDGAIEPPSQIPSPALDRTMRMTVQRLDAIVMRGLERDPAGRFETAREMALALERALAPATASQVSEWVESIASDVLLLRAAQIADIESSSAALARPLTPSTPSPTQGSLRPRPGRQGDAERVTAPPIDGHSGGGLSSVSVATSNPGPESPVLGRRRRLTIGVGLAVLVLVPLAALAVVRSNAPERVASPVTSGIAVGTTPQTSSTSTARVAEPLGSEESETAPAPPRTAATASPDAGSQPLPTATLPVARPPPAHEAREVRVPKKPPSPSVPSECNPPFVYDAAGMKHYKPECL